MLEKFLAYPDREMLDYDLRFLYGLRKRIPLEGNGPRVIYLEKDKLFVPTYFADILNIIELPSNELTTVAMNPSRKETKEHLGEKYFNDAMNCFQNWQSCNGCHPGDARMDAMNWDLMNDGIGNPKNCKSLLYSHVTPPCMISGIRESAELAVRAGYKFIQFFDIDEESADCVDAYLKALRPVPSPYLINGKLSKKAEEGRKIFDRINCGYCHSGPYFTDMKMHRIGDNIEFEKGWDTPTLIEVWRTAPYLFNGSAATLDELFTNHKHGVEKQTLSPKEIKSLIEYVNSL
jgi:cytochrome c peroxidase